MSRRRPVYAEVVAADPKNAVATEQLGYIALLGNQLDEAEKWLKKAILLTPDSAQARVKLAETYYRQNNYPKAAAVLREIGPKYVDLVANYSGLLVPQLEDFASTKPYQLQGAGEITRLKFVKSEPLPVVNVRINGGKEVTFFIDTGGSELLLDTDFARELGIKKLGAVQGTFSGGQHAEVQSGRIESLTLGDWTVRNLPVAMLGLRQLSEGFGVKELDGCLGTLVLNRFLATLDFPHGELVLRKRSAKNLKAFQAQSGKSVSVPFYVAGAHFMIAMGQVESNPPAMLFIDTGLAGAGVKLAESAIKQGGIKLEEDKASEGAGGGGNLRIVPYVVKELSLGAVKEQNVAGLYDGPFPWEHAYGFYLSGMVGHDFFKPYAVTFDFDGMKVYLQKP